MHILNRRKQPVHVTEPQWLRLAFCCSFCSMYAGVFTAFAFPELAWGVIRWAAARLRDVGRRSLSLLE